MSYDNLNIVPRVVSTIEHRGDGSIDTRVVLAKHCLQIPILPSPMPDVCNSNVAIKLANCGIPGILHRFQTIEEQTEELRVVIKSQYIAGAAIGVTGDYLERAIALHEAGCRLFCLDTANGANIQVSKAMDNLRTLKRAYFIAGNVISKECYKWLDDIGVDAVRVGIGGGTACTTRTETGVYRSPQAILGEIDWFKHTYIHQRSRDWPDIIADGGIRTPADMCKALVLGADCVMIGGLLAGCRDSPASYGKCDTKIFRGSASYDIQLISGKEPKNIEGDTIHLELGNSIKELINRFKEGLLSSMSYCNARNLEEFRANATIERNQ